MKILFLSQWFPYPTNNGSKIRIFNLLRMLAQYHTVTLLSFLDQPDIDPDVPELRSLCKDIQVVSWKPFEPQSQRPRFGFLSFIPRSVIDTFSLEMQQRIEQLLTEQCFDLVIASQGTMAGYGHCFKGVVAIYEEIELGVIYQQFANARSTWFRLRYGLTWAKHRLYQTRSLRHFRACTVVSEKERQLVSRAVPSYKWIEVIPNCINIADYKYIEVTPQPNTLIFTGPFHYHANHDAMIWFLEEIFPYVQSVVPEVSMVITGDHADLPLPQANNLTLTGFVDDIRPLIASSWLSLVPLRVGGGTRLKILEAMALRTPIVSTTKGAEGLDAQHGEHILIADTPQEFAEAVLKLLQNPELRQRLTDNAYQFVSKNYDCAVTMSRFLDLVERVADV